MGLNFWGKKSILQFQKGFGVKRPKDLPDTTETINIIEKIVYQGLKEYGFKKHGRTLHRFVSEDISQVINFQSGKPADGMAGIFCVNLGIRVPECFEMEFNSSKPLKKYYHEYECNIRSRLGVVTSGKDIWYDLNKTPEKIGNIVLKQIKNDVIPVFDILCSREAILQHRREYKSFDILTSRSILLQEALIYGHLGDITTAKRLFKEHYDNCVREYDSLKKHGRKEWIRKGERMVYKDQYGVVQDITASKSGYITVYDANHLYIENLDKLAEKLGF
jgi:hypothetical protein